ncbi:ATP-binding cassette domain-containing protein, partial [Pseudomonas paraeruginosa]
VPLASNISLDGDFIQLRGVRKAYGEQLVVMDDMNLDMRADDRLVIIGPSGSGKSSLLRVLMGLEGIQGGTISFQGKPYINGERRPGKPLDES